MRYTLSRTAGMVISVLLLFTSAAEGQTRSTSSRVPVTVALVQQLPVEGQPYVLMRRADGVPQDVILLSTTATPEVLSAAVTALLAVRLQRGDIPSTTELARLSTGRGARGQSRFPWAGRVMADLRRTQATERAGVGSVPHVEIWLPRQRRQR